MIKNHPVYFILAFMVLVSSAGCAAKSTSVSTPTITTAPTFTATSTITLTPTSTNTPTQTATLTPTPRTPLSAENINQWQVFTTLGGISGVDIAFTPDGKQIVVAEHNSIVFYDASSLQIQNSVDTNHPVFGLSLSKNGNVLLAMDDQQNITSYQLPSGSPISDPAQLKDITGYCSEGETLSAYTWWWSRLFCVPEQAARFTSDRYVGGLITMAFNPDATLAALGGQYGFELISLEGGRKGQTKWNSSKLTPVWGTAAAFSPDGQKIALGFQDGAVFLLNVETGEELAQYPIGGQIRGINFNADGSQLAVTSNTGSKVINLANDQIDQIGSVTPGEINDMAFSPDGRYFFTVNGVGRFMLWNVADGSLIFQQQGTPCKIDDIYFNWLCYSGTGDVAYSSDGILTALGDNGTVQIIDSASGYILHKLEVGQILSLAFSPDGSHIAISTLDINKGLEKIPDGVQLWDIAGEKLLKTYAVKPCTHRSVLYNCTKSLSFTSDGQVLITTGDRSIALWDTSTGEQIQNQFDPKMTRVDQMDLSSDGTLLAALGDILKLWTVDGHEITPNAFAIIPDSMMFALDPLGRFLAVVSYVSNHGNAPDKYVVKIVNAADQKPLGSFDIEMTGDSDLSHDSIAFSPSGDVLAIAANGSVYFYAVQP